LAFIKPEATIGTKNTYPFNFEHHNIKSIELEVGSKQLPYTHLLEFDFNKNLYIDGYMTLYDIVGKPDNGNNISREVYGKGYTLFAFNLKPTLNCGNDFINLGKSAPVTVTIYFNDNKDTPSSLDMITYLEYNSGIEINNLRQILQ